MGVLHYDFKGMLYDEWELNKVYTSHARTITADEVSRYSALSGDYNPLYTNAFFAKQSLFGRSVLPGGLTFIIANGLSCQTLWFDGSYIGLLDQQMKFTAPADVGDTVYLTLRPTAKRLTRKPGRGIVTYEVQLFNQDDVMLLDGVWVILMAVDREHME
jgi:acyl dehydratase